MNFRDDTKPPLSTERSDHTWGTHLTYSERLAEDLDDRPSRLLLLLAEGTGRRASWTGARGVARIGAPVGEAPAVISPSGGGPDPKEDQ